jgi:sugar/nucleoside kinase (ribokinase family)
VTSPTPGRVVVVGDVVTDVLAVYSGPLAEGSDTAARVRIGGGGSAANTAAWLAGLGIPVDLVGVVGADPAGDARLAELAAAGVGLTYVRRTGEAPTGTVIVLAHAQERSMLSDRGANGLLSVSDVESCLAAGPAHLHLSGYTLLDERTARAGRHALATAARSGWSTSVDAASAAPLRQVGGDAFLDWVRGADLLLANLDEARALLPAGSADAGARELAERLSHTVRHAVVKVGGSGAVWASRDGATVAVPAVPVADPVDPTGAGDAFAAGLLSSWLAGEDPGAALARGVGLGARAVTVVGGRPA